MKETAQKEMARRWWHEEQLRSQGMPTWNRGGEGKREARWSSCAHRRAPL